MWKLAGLALAAALVTSPAAAQPRLFGDDSEVAFTLSAPWSRFVRDADESVDPVDGTIAFDAGPGIALKIAPRGFTRRTGDICSFPPIKLDFDKPAMEGTAFEGQNKLKLVTQCRPQASYEQMLVREYTVYRLYNAVTPMSFRVRPARVTYRDTEGRREENTRFNFLIEDAGDVAKRNGLVEMELDARSVASQQIDAAGLVRFSLFQLLIGNLDWEYYAGPTGDTCCHNGKLIAAEGATSGFIPVPYDFDFSELVDAPYAAPPEGLNVSGPFDRYYRGHCRATPQVPAAVALLQSKRAAFAAIIAGESRLSDASKRAMMKTLDEGFALLENTRKLEREISTHCR